MLEPQLEGGIPRVLEAHGSYSRCSWGGSEMEKKRVDDELEGVSAFKTG